MTKPKYLLAAAICFLACPTAQAEDIWAPLQFLVGSWEGTVKGQPGEGRSLREYRPVLNGRYIEELGTSTYPPQKANPKGEVHQERGYFSFDRARKKFVFRQFHIEGFVNQYASEGVSADSKALVFVSEAIENIPAGWRARETYRSLRPDEFEETFELAEPGKEFEVYSQTHFRRKKSY